MTGGMAMVVSWTDHTDTRKGRVGGRRPKLNTHQQQEIVRLVNSGVLIPLSSIFWPPDHKKYPVLIAGWVKHPCKSDITSVVISVTDEYGIYNYKNQHFVSVVLLEAWLSGNDKDGRIYTVTAVATHRDGRKTTTVARVIVPHDLSLCNHEWSLCSPR
jgi:hypothetical protein